MINTITILKPREIKAIQLDYSKLYAPIEAVVYSENINNYSITVDIQIKDFNGKPDLKIGNFGYNFYFRPNSQMKNGRAYKDLSALARATKRACIKQGFTFLGFCLSNNN